ncbi:Holliday junction branch migration protein RuvA [Serpentinicella alkaliphila]|uniref:Holliday junction branch migration complex subunit RuvA n=1 Tax=Serpentinicella alkaliphila TaxID=1734049 RepID=A0A4R2TY25_9FIRM|nr:Holliday junction branch migration protein RuvA [Serpentinicella alkaliphila]QUH26742.1 Holliday junction branch migration protein RuvA [Serpentinicella alkaliphila]TCQ07962.1 Holliday junction DNA helicase subunit RuvA [Serpentinicella alkaliphila]
MYEYIKGRIEDILLDKIIVDVNGIGYRINSSLVSASQVTKGDIEKIFTYLVVREDEINLYGFKTREELNMFQKLLSVSKVGPKVAASILSMYNTSTLGQFILSNNIGAISKVSGVGKKTAERIILELKDKIDANDSLANDNIVEVVTASSKSEEAIEALMTLGYTKYEINKVLDGVGDDFTTEETIKLALKRLM